MKIFQVKPEIYSETGSIGYLSQVKAEKALLVTDQVMVKLGIVAKVTNLLESAKINYEIFDEVEPDPSMETVIKGVKKMDGLQPDLLIGLGGGSSMDTAKALYFSHCRLRKQLEPQKEHKKALFIAIPTTSGTGSEVTAFSVITDKEKAIKIPLYNEELVPDVAILDPDLVKTVPPSVTADTGLDALTQAIEAYVSTIASDYTNALAEKSIRMIFRYLLRAYRNGDDTSARAKMHNASCMAGIAFNNAFLGLNHSMAHVLGAKFHLSHGRANAIMLPYVIEYNAQSESTRESKKYADIAQIIGLKFSTIGEGVTALIEAVKTLNKDLNIPRNLHEAGVDEETFFSHLAEISEIALHDYCTKTNPRRPTALEIADIFKKAYIG